MKNPIFLQKPTPDHCGPGCVGKSKYLETKNLLSEFDTEEKRLTVLRNLGILNSQIDIVQELGDDTSVVMSQKAVTDAINNNKNIEIYESENNLPTSAETGRIAAVVYQTNNETVNRLYFKNEEAWKSLNDVKIVDSVNKLDKNAERGSLATVAVNTNVEVPFSELYQPTEEDFNSAIPPVSKLSKVNRISVIAPDPLIEPTEFEIKLYSEDFNPESNIGKVVVLDGWGYFYLYDMADDSQNMEFNLFIYNEEENTITINEEILAELNNILSEKGYVYGGTYEDYGLIDDPSVSDFIYHVIEEIQKTDIYIKDVEGWKVLDNEELRNQISDLEVNLANLENTVNNLEDKTTLIVNSVDELDPDAPTGTLANVVYGDQPILKPISEQGIKQIIFGDFVGESFIIPEETCSITFSYSSLINLTSLSASYSPDTATVDLYCTVYMTSSKLCSYKIDTKEITELNQQLIDDINIKLKNGNLSGSIYTPSDANEEACYKFFDQFIKNQVGYIPATVYSYTKYESGWEQYDKILKSRNIFNSPNDLDSNSELGCVCSVVETSDEPIYSLLDNGTVGTLQFGYFNDGEFIDLPSDIINLPMSQGYSISGSLPLYTHKLSVTKNLTTNRIIFQFTHYAGGGWKPSFEFDVNTLSFTQPALTPFALGNCNFSTSESNLEFLSQFFIQKRYPKVTKLYTKNETGWEQYKELADGSVTIEKLSTDVQESLTKVNNFLDTAAQSDEVIDTLKEIQEYIESDTSGASAMITDIATNKSNIEELTARLDELNNSVEIVNDLTTGGTDKALSAEMGKTLNERIEEVAEITNSGEEVTVQIVDENVVGLPISRILEFTEIRANSILRNETTVDLANYSGNKGEIIVVKNYSDTDNVLKDVFMYKMPSAINGTSSGSYDVYQYTQSLYVTDGTTGEYVFQQYAYDNTYYRNAEDDKIYSFNNSTTIQEVTPKKSVSIQEAIDDIYSKLALLTT